MKVLVLSFQDSGGGVGRLARAIDGLDGHEARAARWRKGRLRYDVGFKVVWQPNRARTLALMEWADAVIVSGCWFGLPKKLPWGTNSVFPPGAPRRPTVINYRGTPYRGNRKRYDAHDASRGHVQSGNFLDLTLYGKRKAWLPVPVWADEIAANRAHHGNKRLLVAQAVTLPRRFGLKRTAMVRKQLKGIPGVGFDVITKVDNAECLRRIGRADLVVTAFKNGFGNAGLEAMAMGIPVVADGFPALIEEYKRKLGTLPFLRCAPGQIGALVVNLRDNREIVAEYGARGSAYVRKWHNPERIGRKAVMLCELARDRLKKRKRK